MSVLLTILSFVAYAIPWIVGISIVGTIVGVSIDLSKKKFYWTTWGFLAIGISILIVIAEISLTYQTLSQFK